MFSSKALFKKHVQFKMKRTVLCVCVSSYTGEQQKVRQLHATDKITLKVTSTLW